ncbi:MAG: RNase adapter RapZ [Elusimicrobia bacterium]|nr:RNase adapter RapZ [Elusimicrobiota bacterium]
MIKNFIIVTGISGAGKSQALKVLEDLSFVCVDNIPVELIESFVNLYNAPGRKASNTAISIDARAPKAVGQFESIIKQLKSRKINYKILFFDAADNVLFRRYSETRRKHPLGKGVSEGVSAERAMFKGVRLLSDAIIDTSAMALNELRAVLSKIAGAKISKSSIMVKVCSFGFKYGAPSDADIIFDMRFLKNPNYVANLKEKTGRDKPVKNYVRAQKAFKSFLSGFSNQIISLLPHYINEGKNYLTVAIGCTGGKHRSVVTAEDIAKIISDKGYKVDTHHRDIMKTK